VHTTSHQHHRRFFPKGVTGKQKSTKERVERVCYTDCITRQSTTHRTFFLCVSSQAGAERGNRKKRGGHIHSSQAHYRQDLKAPSLLK